MTGAALRAWYLPRGRMGRRRWWTAYVLPLLAAGAAAWGADLATGVATLDSDASNPALRVWLAFGWVSTVYWPLVLVPMTAGWAVRLHDRGLPAWWLLGNAVPVLGTAGLLGVAGLVPGTDGPNAYGPPPAA